MDTLLGTQRAEILLTRIQFLPGLRWPWPRPRRSGLAQNSPIANFMTGRGKRSDCSQFGVLAMGILVHAARDGDAADERGWQPWLAEMIGGVADHDADGTV
jgi:hypothetical protein